MPSNSPRPYADLRNAISAELEAIAANRRTTTYEALAAKFSEISGPSDPKLMKILDEIAAEDHAAGRPLKPALVRNKQRNEPGRRFFENARKIGVLHQSQPEDAFLWDTIRRLHDGGFIPVTDYSKPAKGNNRRKGPRNVSPHRLMNFGMKQLC